MPDKRDITLLLICAVLLGWLFWGQALEKQPPTPTLESTGVSHHITHTEDGFEPKESTINLGDTVTFSTETAHPFWPASNLHPSHRDYPAFDPREPILSGETWSFTFTQVGEWKFHDHLAPYFTGVIIVSE